MAKRKRATKVQTTPKKRAKGVAHAHGDVDPDKEYKLRSIVDETNTKYLIEWEDDSDTGQQYAPTWEIKSNANELAVKDWESKKKDRKRPEQSNEIQRRSRSTSALSSPPGSPNEDPAGPRRRGRPRKVVESSPTVEESRLPSSGTRQNPLQIDDLLEIGESQHIGLEQQARGGAESSLFVTDDDPNDIPQSDHTNAAVRPSPPPSSWREYQAFPSSQAGPVEFTQASDSQAASEYLPEAVDTSKTTEDTTEVSLHPTAPSATQPDSLLGEGIPNSNNVVPDSEDIGGSQSYHPSIIGTVSSPVPDPHPTASLELEYLPASTEERQNSPNSTALSNSTSLHQDSTGTALVAVDQAAPTSTGDKNSESANADVVSLAESGAGSLNEEAGVSTLNDLLPQPENHPEAEVVSEDYTKAGAEEHSQPPTVSVSISSEGQQDPVKVTKEPVQSGTYRTNNEPEQNEINETDNGPEASIQPLPTESEDTGPVAKTPDTPKQSVQILNSDTTIGDRQDLFDNFLESTSTSRQSPVAQIDEQPFGPDIASSGVSSSPPAKDFSLERVILTDTQINLPSTSQFPVTPPRRRPRAADLPREPASIDWQSTFPFQTQPPLTSRISQISPARPTTSSHPAFSNIRKSVEQPFPSPPPVRSSPFGPSSSIPAVPSQSIEFATFGETAPPPPPRSHSNSRHSPSVVWTMGDSQTPGLQARAAGGITTKDKASEDDRTTPIRQSATSATPEQTPGLRTGRSSRISMVERMKQIDREREVKKAALRAELFGSAAPSQDSSNAVPTSSAASNVALGGATATPKLASAFLRVRGSTRSPSAVPAEELLPIITQEEMNTSGRYETLLPQSQDGSGEAQRNGSLASLSAPLERLTSGENPELANVHVVPIHLIGHQRDQYPNMVYQHKTMIDRYLSSTNPSANLTQEAKEFVDRVRRIAMHPDLDNFETLTQFPTDPSVQADWDVGCSAKFRFLKDLLDASRDSNLRIAIVAQLGRILDILEIFLQGIKIAYGRSDVERAANEHPIEGSVRVKLLATNPEEAKNEPVDLIIAMDNSIHSDTKQVRALRHGTRAPLVTLVIPYTVEHVERCLAPTLSDRTWTHALVSGIDQFSRMAGKPEDSSQAAPKNGASLLAQYMTGALSDWPLPSLKALPELDSQTESEIDVTTTSMDTTRLTHAGDKRPREGDEMDIDPIDSSKRPRVEAAGGEEPTDATRTINPRNVDLTHVSDSIGKTTQLGAEAEDLPPNLNEIEQRLQDLLIAKQDELDEHVKQLSDLQYRYEEQRNNLADVTKERDAAIETAQKALTRLSEESNKMSSLKVENTTLKQEKKEADEKLLSHAVPEIVEFEALRQSLAQAHTERDKLATRHEQTNREIEYVRNLYQGASNSAQSTAAQITELESQLAVATNKATGEHAKLRQMGYDAFTKNLQDENKRLKAKLHDRENLLRAKDEELAKLKEAGRGRMGTRGTSVPRSSRLGSPRVGSRQTSPTMGELRGKGGLLHPLRNAEK